MYKNEQKTEKYYTFSDFFKCRIFTNGNGVLDEISDCF